MVATIIQKADPESVEAVAVGSRRDQVFADIQANRGTTAAEIADRIGASAKVVRRCTRQLTKRGLIYRDEASWPHQHYPAATR
ncbi:MAG: winged helix-turn-helix domain-containing protein [Rhodospirillaceae bacterium]|nr:winged helix-turn-helix domain-containing protein [Rhodospirillaceae bacterium]